MKKNEEFFVPEEINLSKMINKTLKLVAVEFCDYTGSFQVSGEDPEERSLLIRSRLKEMKEGGKSKSILLVISLAGIKVCSPDGKTVFMAHALRRISYATCDPGQKQFSFLAREPKANFSLQYCHAFITNTADQAEELNSIVGHAFRLAYAAHLQKSSSPVKDVIPSFSSSSGHFAYNQSQSQSPPSKTGSTAPGHSSNNHRRLQSHHTTNSTSTPYHPSCSSSDLSTTPNNFTSEPTSPVCCSSTHLHHTLPHTLTHTHTDQRPCSSTCLSRAEFNRENLKAASSCCSSCSSRPSSRCSSNTAIAAVSSHFSKSLPLTSSGSSVTMRTPTPGNNISVGNQCGVLKPPSTLPGLHYNDHENNNNNLHSPDSDTSNSPTELNTTRRLGDKPPLIKNVNISLEANLQLEEELNSVLSCPLNVTTTQCPTLTTSTTQQGNTSVIGYVNDKHANETFSNTETCSSDEKCLLQDELHLKRMSQISMNSSMTSGNVIHDVSSSSNFSNTPLPPPLPERSDSLTPPEEPHLKTAAWFQAGIPREIALEVLSREPVGAFMVRESTSKPGCYALSLRVPRDFTVSGIAHYLIVKTTKGYKIKGFTKEFVTLTALITHHSVMPELLPCPLSLSRYNPTFTADDNRNDDDDNSDEDPDYNTLSDFRKMMADLNV